MQMEMIWITRSLHNWEFVTLVLKWMGGKRSLEKNACKNNR